MVFNDPKPIYIQIGELICDKIAAGSWHKEERIPSVRELAGELEVNPNTVMRAYEWMAQQGVIYNRRGIGFFVSADALQIITKMRRDELFNTDLRHIAQRMSQLNITPKEVVEQLERYLK